MSRVADATRAIVSPKDAATVLLLRECASGPFEVFMLKRHRESAFMGGAHVFPGGKVDASDRDPRMLARARGRTPDETKAALGEEELGPHAAAGMFGCAVRETFEECGVLLGDVPNRERLTDMDRTQTETFADFLLMMNAWMRFDRLTPWTRWITPTVEPRRYDTRFFLARANAEDAVAEHDAHETVEHAWWTPQQALAKAQAGDIMLAPPTQRSLEMLTAFDSIDGAFAEAASRPPPRVQPHFVKEGETVVLALPGDRAHPEPAAVLPGTTRFELRNGRWW